MTSDRAEGRSIVTSDRAEGRSIVTSDREVVTSTKAEQCTFYRPSDRVEDRALQVVNLQQVVL